MKIVRNYDVVLTVMR